MVRQPRAWEGLSWWQWMGGVVRHPDQKGPLANALQRTEGPECRKLWGLGNKPTQSNSALQPGSPTAPEASLVQATRSRTPLTLCGSTELAAQSCLFVAIRGCHHSATKMSALRRGCRGPWVHAGKTWAGGPLSDRQDTMARSAPLLPSVTDGWECSAGAKKQGSSMQQLVRIAPSHVQKCATAAHGQVTVVLSPLPHLR